MSGAKEEIPNEALPGFGCLFLCVAGVFLFLGVIFSSEFVLDLGYFSAALAYIFIGIGLILFAFMALENIGRAITFMIFGYVFIRIFTSETDIIPELIGYLLFIPASAYVFISQTKRLKLNLSSGKHSGSAFLKYAIGLILALVTVWAGMKLVEYSIHGFYFWDSNILGRIEFVQNAGRWNNLLNGFTVSIAIVSIPILLAMGFTAYVYFLNSIFRKLNMADQTPAAPKFFFKPKTPLASREEITKFISENPGTTDLELMRIFPGLTISYLQKIYSEIFSDASEKGEFKTAMMLKHLQNNPKAIAKITLTPNTFRVTIVNTNDVFSDEQKYRPETHRLLSKLESELLKNDRLNTEVIHETDNQFYFFSKSDSGSKFFDEIEFLGNEADAIQLFREKQLEEVFAFPTPSHISHALIVIEEMMKN